MKLSAPPPPPPSPEEPDPNEPKPEAGAPVLSHEPTPAEAAAPAPALAWPAWFAAADFLLAALAIVLAFMVASFVARNTDVWLHLAAGQRLLSGNYTPGSDPFSYSAAERAWVNHSLLYDVGSYLLFRADSTGALLVIAKALAVALAFGFILSLRRPGYSLWPWASVAVVAVLAAAPRLILSPLVGSLLLLAVTLVLIFRMPHRPNSWRFPIAIGITFWLWAMVDSWFFIGPFALGLILIGELAQRALTGSSAKEGEAQPLGPVPDSSTLAKALGIGIIACMFNPHHVRIWELPFELVGPDSAKVDIRFKQLLTSPLDGEYRESTPFGRTTGYNMNGLAYVSLFVGGMLVLGLGAGRLRFAHLALWVGFGLLSLTSIYVIPFFAIVSVPIIAAQLNAVSTLVRLKSWGDPTTRFVLVGSASGRVITLLLAAAGCILAWPGWVHPQSGDPSSARRVAWEVYQDDGMVLAAQQLEDWRKEGRLPPGARGLITTTELANYCAWFAPSEKVFMNARYNHHRKELSEYLAIRKGFALIQSEDAPAPGELEERLRNLGVEYVALSAPRGGTRSRSQLVAMLMWRDTERWSPWYLNGRSMIAGWRDLPAEEKPTFASLRLDPLALAFGPRTERLDPGRVKLAPPAMGWEQEFIRGVNISPPGADEAIGWALYGDVRSGLIDEKRQVVRFALALVDYVAGGSGAIRYFMQPLVQAMTGDSPQVDELSATAFLALRAARRAIAADPDHPDGYFALSVALSNRQLLMSDEERTLARITALRQSLARIPPPERYKPGSYLQPAAAACAELFKLYMGIDQPNVRMMGFTGMSVNLPALIILREFSLYVVQTGKGAQLFPARLAQQQRILAGPFLRPLDSARDTLLLMEKYLPLDIEKEDERKNAMEELQHNLKQIETQYRESNNAYEREREKARNRGLQMKLREQVEAALQFNLVEEALRLLTDRDTDLGKEFGRDALKFALLRVGLRLITGRLEDAADDLDILPANFDEAEATAPKDFAQYIRQLRDPLRMQIFQKLVLEGNYAEAGALLEQMQEPIIRAGGEILPPEKAIRFTWPTGLSTSGFDVVMGMRLWYLERLGRYENERHGVFSKRNQEVEFFYRRGLLSLIEGDIAGARRRFEQAHLPAIKEWDLPELRKPDAERLLRLIKQAEKSAR